MKGDCARRAFPLRVRRNMQGSIAEEGRVAMSARHLVVLVASAVVSASAGHAQCAGDIDGDNVVMIAELIAAVNSALTGCPTPTSTRMGEASATPTATATVVATATRTPLPSPTATATTITSPTRTGTATATTTGTATPTQSPTEVPAPQLRSFCIAPGTLLAPPEGTATGLFTSSMPGNTNAAQFVSAGPLILRLLEPSVAGVAPLRLERDVVIEILLLDNSRQCWKLSAEGSNGSIDCDGGTPYDVLATRSSLAPGSAFEVARGGGAPAGPGHGDLVLMSQLQIVPPNDATPCDQVAYTSPQQPLAFTTAQGTAAVDGTILSLTISGEPFDCSDFGSPLSGGQLVAPHPANQAPAGDVVSVIRLAQEQDCPAEAVCSLQPGTCVGGENDGRDCTAAAQCPSGTCSTDGDISKVELNLAAIPGPLAFPIQGSIKIDVADTGNERPMQCEIQQIDPIVIPNIGVVCITPSAAPCPAGMIDCDGGPSMLGVDVLSDGDIGDCQSNLACEVSCTDYCADSGGALQSAACTGYCSGSTPQPCTADLQCLGAGNGTCNGPDPIGSTGGICQCQCINAQSGPASDAGEFQCHLAALLAVETAPPCDGVDVAIQLGDACIPLTTSEAQSNITNADFNRLPCPGGGPPCMVPPGGVIRNSGNPIGCDRYATGALSGLRAVGVFNSLGSALGDVATELFAACKPAPPGPR
jgi:hypothetical protein